RELQQGDGTPTAPTIFGILYRANSGAKGLSVGEPAAAIDDLTSEAVAVAAIPEEGALPEIIAAEPLALGIKGTLPFVIAFALQILTFWTVDIVSPAVPDIKDDLAMSATGAGLIFSLFFAGRLAASFPAAFLV